MLNHSKKTNSRASFHQLMAATLTIGGISLLSPMLVSAQTVPLTPARQAIDNTATGTYVDPNNPTTTLNATSNKVTVTVAEVAGITNVPAGTVDINGGSVTTNDAVDYSFLITNVGNDASAFHIPVAAGTDLVIVGASLGNTSHTATGTKVFVTQINGVNLTTPVELPADGLTNNAAFVSAVQTTGGLPTFDGTVPAGGTIKVLVPVTVTETIAGNPVSVRLGNTGNNDNTAGTQNQPQAGTLTGDVYTVDNNPGNGSPVNGTGGVQEASAFQTVPLATQINSSALATVLKTRTAYSNAGTPSTFNDDIITYRLDLKVETNPPAVGITPAPLLGTQIKYNGSNATKILISDAIPAGTSLDPALTAGTVVINGVTWTRVYTTAATGVSPLDVSAAQNWVSAVPGGTITRIGYIADGPLPTGYSTTSVGLPVQLITTGLSATLISPATIANIAQVFGQTTAGVVSPTNPLVYDESGDQNPNNYETGVPSVAPITTPNISPDGVAVPANDGTDGGNNNTGTGSGGEDNVLTINPPGTILNGPQGQAGAIGPDATNQTDFVNKSAPVIAGLKTGDPIDPSAVTFINTVENPSTNVNKLDNVTLEPISATLAATATGKAVTVYDLSNVANHAVLPDGTTVRIIYGGRSALYTLTGSDFVLTSSTSGASVNPTTLVVTVGTADTTAPIIIPSLAVGQTADYYVQVDLPGTATVTKGYSVPIVAYVNSNTGDSSTFKTIGTKLLEDNPFNIKIDRVYTGYLDLSKQSRILQGTGPVVPVADQSFSIAGKKPAPGNIIEYQVTYKNISTPTSGSGNVILNANNIVITEDGNDAAVGNNWATFTTNMPNTAADATAGAAITYFVNGIASTTADPAVNVYKDTIPTIAPAGVGTFNFQRLLK